MESQPQNPEFKNNPEIFHPCYYLIRCVDNLSFKNVNDTSYLLLKLLCHGLHTGWSQFTVSTFYHLFTNNSNNTATC